MKSNLTESNNIERQPDCVTEIKVGHTALVVKGYLNSKATETAIDKMARILQVEIDSKTAEIA